MSAAIWNITSYSLPTQRDSSTIHLQERSLPNTSRIAFKSDGRNNKPFEVTITMEDFLRFPKVIEFISSKGFSNNTAKEILVQYVPARIVISGNPKLIQGGGHLGAIGSQAMKGYTAWAMQYANISGYYTASYNIVLGMRGEIVAISPTMHALNSNYHFMSFKPYPGNPRYFLGGVDDGTQQSGPVYIWNWDGSDDMEYTRLGGPVVEVDCHDITMAYEGGAFWAWVHDSSNECGLKKVNASTGRQMKYYRFEKCESEIFADINHVHFLEKDTIAVISSRYSNSFVKVNLTSLSIMWVCGGDQGDFDIIDENGIRFGKGVSLWKGQHNVEYIGNSEYLLFDDHYAETDGKSTRGANESRALLVKIDEEVMSAKILRSQGVGAWQPIFGDHDQMPTGNFLTASWVGSLQCDDWATKSCDPYSYDAQIVETVRDTHEVAWSARIYGNSSAKLASVYAGWSMYSAERIFLQPIVFDLTCVNRGYNRNESNAPYVTISASVHNTFKQSNAYEGRYSIYDGVGSRVVTGSFEFLPFWEKTVVSVNVSHFDCNGKVKIENEWGQVTYGPLFNSE